MKCEGILNRKTTRGAMAALMAAAMMFSTVQVYATESESETDSGTAVKTAAGTGVDMSTDYPGLSVTAGESISFPLDFTSLDGEGHDVSLTTESLPDGWTGYFKGNNTEVTKVHVSADSSESDSELAEYSLTVPADAVEGDYEVNLLATSDDGTEDALTLALTVTAEEAGESNFTSEYPEQQGASGTSFSFDTTIVNNRGTGQTYSLSADAPEGWTVSFAPSDDTSTAVASIEVEAGSSQGLLVSVTPPDNVEKGDYSIPVSAVSSSDTLSTELTVSITGTYAVTLSTSDGRLSFDAYENKQSSVTLTITNNGNVDLTNLNLSSSAPTDWEVTFSESTIDTLEAGASKEVTAYVTPCEDAVTGDYVTTLTVSNSEASSSADFRVSVKTSTTWGVAAICIIVVLIIALAVIFKRYGRR